MLWKVTFLFLTKTQINKWTFFIIDILHKPSAINAFKTCSFSSQPKRSKAVFFSPVHKIAFSFQNELIPFIPKRWRKRQFTPPFLKPSIFTCPHSTDSSCSQFPSISVFDDRPKRIKKYARFQANTKIWCYSDMSRIEH